MFSARLLACAVVAIVTGVAAAAADQEIDSIEIADKRVLLCAPGESHFRIDYPPGPPVTDKPFAERRILELGALVKWQGDPATDANARRALSDHAQYSCGRFSIDFTTGFFNSNPQGELGAADEFAVFSISAGGKAIEVQMSGHWCPEHNTRAAHYLSNNATAIEGRYNAQTRKHELLLSKTVCDAERKAWETMEIQSLD
jgi:hypothetical protein